MLVVALLVLALPVMIVQIILWSSLPRTILLAQIQDRAGLRIELGDVRVSWAGQTTIHSLSAALPLEQHPFLTTREVRIQHASLLSILLSRTLNIQAAEVDAPRIFAIEDQSGTWNLDTVASTLNASLDASTSPSSARPLTLPGITITGGTLTVARHSHTPVSIPFSIRGSYTAPHVWTLSAEADTLRVNGRLMTASPWIHDLSIGAQGPPALARSLLPELDIPHTIDVGWKGSLAPPGKLTGPTLHASINVRSVQNNNEHLQGHATLVANADRITLTPHNLTLTRLDKTRSPLSITRGTLTLTRDALNADGLIADHAGHRLTLRRGSVDLIQRAATASIAWQTLDPQSRGTRPPAIQQPARTAAISPSAADLTHRGEATLEATFPADAPRTLHASFSSNGLALAHRWSARGDLQLEQQAGQDPTATLSLTNLHLAPPLDSPLPPSGIVLDGLTLGARLTKPGSPDASLELVSADIPGARTTHLDAAYHLATGRWNASIHVADLDPHTIVPDLLTLLPDDADLRELAAQPISLIASSSSGPNPPNADPLRELSLDLHLATLHVHLATNDDAQRSIPPTIPATSPSPDPAAHHATHHATLRLTLAEDPAAPAAFVALTDLTGPLDATFDVHVLPTDGATTSPTLRAVGSLTAHAPRAPSLATLLTPSPASIAPQPLHTDPIDSTSQGPLTLPPWHVPLTIELNSSDALLTTPGLAWQDTTIDLNARHEIATNTQSATLRIHALDLQTLLLALTPDPPSDKASLPRGTFQLALSARTTALNTSAAIIEGSLSGTALSIPIALSAPRPLPPHVADSPDGAPPALPDDLPDLHDLAAPGAPIPTGVQRPPTHTLTAATARASFTLSPGTLDLHELHLAQPDATLQAKGTLTTSAQPREHALSVVADNWPLALDDSKHTFRLTGNATTASTPDPSRAAFEIDLALARERTDPLPLLTLLTTGTLTTSPASAPTIQADRIDASLLGGTITGHAHVPISEPLTSTLTLNINALDLDHPLITELIQAIAPPDADPAAAHPLQGLLTGTIKLEPSADPRAHTPRHLSAHLTTSGGSIMRLPLDDISLSLYVSDQRHVLDHASFTLAGGTVALWSRLSRHDDERFMHLSVDAQNLSADIIAKAVDPDAPDAPGLLSLRAALGGYLAPPHRAYGQADIAIADSDLGGLPVIAQLYALLSLDTTTKSPQGWGNARLRLEGDTLHLTRLYYFNRGTDIIGNGEVRGVFAWPQSQISGVAAGAARPLRDSALPFAGLLDRAFLAASSRAVSVAISGTPSDIKAEVVPLADVQSSLGRLLGEPSIRE